MSTEVRSDTRRMVDTYGLRLENIVRRIRTVAYAVALLGVLVSYIIDPSVRGAASLGLLGVAWFVGLTHRAWALGAHRILIGDLVVSLGLWWMYGPVSGAAFVAFGVVVVSAFVLSQRRATVLLVAAVTKTVTEAVIHFVALESTLPLFHPPEDIGGAEFLVGIAIQIAMLAAVGTLMKRISATLRRAHETLALDLESERVVNEMKDRFVATISHQLRTPLTALSGFARMVQDPEAIDDESHAEFMGIVVDQVTELELLVEDLLTLNRLTAGHLIVDSVVVDIEREIHAVNASLGLQEPQVVVDAGSRPTVVGDPARIRQVIRNLIDNALKYGDTPIRIVVSDDGSGVRVRVADAGAGLDPASADAVFQPYFRQVDDATMSQPGLGLGLAIAQGLVEAHGGSIAYLGPGADGGFEISLPTGAGSDRGADADIAA